MASVFTNAIKFYPPKKIKGAEMVTAAREN